MKKIFQLASRINSSNGQINFQLKKSELPKKFRANLPNLKGIKIDLEAFEFENTL